ncbi:MULTISPECIES: hypothetical protein [Bradyrhizobium]|uniref:hypothetical protein n=1 Tax=Bradyrhizobium TaxID=374 RepID=UPI00155F4B1A|nr:MULTISPECIES: hypothetical protein [Bradyrhizobium]MDD1519224.1 hypothetical protein [Bradyrhizobium sp. WBAH30]MDD1543468.1 hypothetical protein [Bradyrhizobium sp. WBAH41]MDD1557598.1 hypothetical protein [Bradyrhizobium sp. WBAH23]MDD1565011.1 hypothetical protein [Bradyrhizobium sp. WBAH33]MDD1590418.1 hypothetical protein [Bradyrhizobium sp. WBAH42]
MLQLSSDGPVAHDQSRIYVALGLIFCNNLKSLAFGDLRAAGLSLHFFMRRVDISATLASMQKVPTSERSASWMQAYRTSEPDEFVAFIADCSRKNPKVRSPGAA